MKRRSAWKYVLSVEATKEPQPLWNKNAGAWRNINVYPLRIWTKENSDDNKKELICFHICRQHAEKYRIVRCCSITWNNVSNCSVPDTTERIDERNLSTPKKTTLVPTEKLLLNPARTKLLSTRIEEQFSEASSEGNKLKTARSGTTSDRNNFAYKNKHLGGSGW